VHQVGFLHTDSIVMHGQQNIKKDIELQHVHTDKYVGFYF